MTYDDLQEHVQTLMGTYLLEVTRGLGFLTESMGDLKEEAIEAGLHFEVVEAICTTEAAQVAFFIEELVEG